MNRPAPLRDGRMGLLPGLALFALLVSGPLAAQDPPPTPDPLPDTIPQVVEEAVAVPVSPGGAFLRSVLVPGWGHVATGSFTRGGFYTAAQGAAAWMLWKSVNRHREARAFQRLERRVVSARLRALGVTDPDSLRIGVETDPAVEEWEELIDRRSQQVEDWVALSLFLVLLGAVDAFVAAHLMDAPEPLTLDVVPGAPGTGIEVRMSVPAGAVLRRVPVPW